MQLDININDLEKKILDAKDLQSLDVVRLDIFGKTGALTDLMKKIGSVPVEQKKEYGQAVNEIKVKLQEVFDSKKSELEKVAMNEKLKSEKLDLTLSSEDEKPAGKLHPWTKGFEEITSILMELGFRFAKGPHVEDDYHNFEALNIPAHHPARQMKDSFFFENGYLLRTETSAVQIHEMEKCGAPLKMFALGRVFRVDNDATHIPMFNQVEGLWIDKDVNMQDLLSMIKEFLQRFFEMPDLKIRVRQHDFPFTEPSVEVDAYYNGKWLELAGAGMTHRKVLENCGVNPDEYQGFAFGFGFERLIMIKEGIKDLRAFYDGNVKFVRHFGK